MYTSVYILREKMQNNFLYNFILPIVSFFLLSSTMLQAEHNTTIDRYYQTISTGVLDLSEYLDVTISQWLSSDNETNFQCATEPITTIEKKNIDAFFQDNKYLNETKETYIRLRIKNYLYSREDNSIKLKLNAQIPFNRCKKEWQLFLQDVQTNNSEIRTTDSSHDGVGIRYYREGFYGIRSNYSLGIRNSSPYVRARYRLPMKFDTWTIEPVQSFKYSSKYHLELETNIYFDKRIDDNKLFRIQLNRESGEHINGVDYGLSFEYFSTFRKNSGLRLRQSFFGNTHYNDYYAFDKDYSGINNYVTSVTYRENIWRKWLYYEVRPTVNFHKDYNYTPSYSLRFILDFYFGKYN